MKNYTRILLAVLLVGVLWVSARGAEMIRVSAAISLREAMTDIAAAYESEGHEEIELNFGASGQLMTQIVNGAPVDAFISAAAKQVDDLVKQNLVDPASRRVIVKNSLVLIVPAAANSKVAKFEDLADADVKRVATGEPRAVPAGMYAKQVLEHLKIDKAVNEKLVFGQNVRQVLDYVIRGEVDAGIVYATDVINAGEGAKIVATADPSAHEPIEYPAVVVKASKQQDAAKKFLDYLHADKAKSILKKRGFIVPE